MKKKLLKKSVCIIAILCLLFGTFSACTTPKKDPAPAPAPSDPSAPAESGGTDAPATEEQTYDLKIAHPHPKGSGTDVGWEKFAELLEEYSDGTIKATIYPGGSLVSSAEGVEAVRSGTVDFAQISSSDLGPLIPAINMIEVPGSYRTDTPDFIEGLAPAMRDAMSPYGIYFLYPQGTASWFFSNIGHIKTFNDMKGLRVRAAGKYGALAVERWGGTSITLSLGDLITAMERNTVDVVLGPGVGAVSLGWYELEHYITVTDIITSMAILAMNQNLYDSMSPTQQDAVNKAGLEMAMIMYELTAKEVVDGLATMKEHGNDIYTFTPEENEAFLAPMDDLRAEVIAEFGEEAQKLDDALKKFR